MIKKVDRQSRAKIESILLSDGQAYALLYLRLLKKLQRVDTMQCLLVLIADALTGTSCRDAITSQLSLTRDQIMTSVYHYSSAPANPTQSSHTAPSCG